LTENPGIKFYCVKISHEALSEYLDALP
jgi:hypothetical protein